MPGLLPMGQVSRESYLRGKSTCHGQVDSVFFSSLYVIVHSTKHRMIRAVT